MTSNSELVDRRIRHAVMVLRYRAGLSKRTVQLLNTADEELVEKLGARMASIEERGYDLGPATTKRLEKMIAELRDINSKVYAKTYKQLTGELEDFAVQEGEFEHESIRAAIVVDVPTVVPSPEKLRAIVQSRPIQGRALKNWADNLERGRAANIEQAIRLGMVQGETIDQIVKRVRGSKAANYTDGVFQGSRQSATTLVRTAVNHVSNHAAQETWKANSDVIKGWQFVATLDSRTTTICASKDRKVYEVGKGPIPPLHPNCRSITVAVTKSFKEIGLDKEELTLGQRASMDGQVAGQTNYETWLKNKGPEIQEEVLGVKRAQLFRDGKLSFEEMVRGDGELWTIQQLKTRYPDLFR